MALETARNRRRSRPRFKFAKRPTAGIRARSTPFNLALNAAVFIPTGNRFTFTGDGGMGGLFGVAAEYDARVIAVAVNARYRLRPTVTLNELVVSSEVVYALGAYVPLRKGTIRVGAGLFGGFGAGAGTGNVLVAGKPQSRTNVGDLDTTPLEWMLNGRMYFTAKRQVYAGLGLGTRLTGGYAPDFRSVAVVGGSFRVSGEVDARPLELGQMDSDPDKREPGCCPILSHFRALPVLSAPFRLPPSKIGQPAAPLRNRRIKKPF
jgi:hypothetical protein